MEVQSKNETGKKNLFLTECEWSLTCDVARLVPFAAAKGRQRENSVEEVKPEEDITEKKKPRGRRKKKAGEEEVSPTNF